MPSANLRTFLNTGAFGPLFLGMKRDEVLSLLGNPEGTGNKGRLLKFGSLQVSFENTKPTSILLLIGLYFRTDSLQLPESICMEGWWPTHNTSQEVFLNHIKNLGIESYPHPKLTFESQTAFLSPAGVTILFDRDLNHSKIDSIQHHSL